MKENMSTAKKKVMVFLTGWMDNSTKALGRQENNTEKEYLLIRREKRGRASGKMENESKSRSNYY